MSNIFELDIEKDLEEEIKNAEIKYKDFNSPHEGYAIIKEELDELWDEIKKKEQLDIRMYKEAIQIACTSIRFCKMIKKNYNEKIKYDKK